MGARGSLQTYPPQDRPLTTLKELRPFIFYKASHESALTPFLGISTRCVDQAQSCSRRKRGRVREDSLGWREGAKGWARNRERQRGLVGAKALQPGRTHSEQLGLTKKTSKTGLVAWLGANGVRWGAEPGSGPGTKLQQTEVRQDRLGWREGAKARGRGRAPKQDTNWCADSLAWRKGVR